jgi:hypothetical protein
VSQLEWKRTQADYGERGMKVVVMAVERGQTAEEMKEIREMAIVFHVQRYTSGPGSKILSFSSSQRHQHISIV